jgi:hypothetical protein
MAKWFAEGTGILSGLHDSEEIDRQIEEDRRKEAAVAEQAAAAELAAALR